MSSKHSLEDSIRIIREAMEQRGLSYQKIGDEIDEPANKLSVAVRCSSGSTQRAIERRVRVAEALGLDPYQVWDEVYLTRIERIREKGYKYGVKPFSKLSEGEWDELPPRMRVRALLKEHKLSLQDLAARVGVTYRQLTAAIYGHKEADDIRKKISEELHHPHSDLWPDIYGSKKDERQPLVERAANSSDMDKFFGFGDLTS